MSERLPDGRFPKSAHTFQWKPPSGMPAGGDGWGGEASGKDARPGGPGRIKGVPLNETAAVKARAILESYAERAARTVGEIAANIEDPRALAASKDVLDRVVGPPKVQVETNGAQQIVIERRIVDPAAPASDP
jgi:hypothetical protein